MKLSSIRVNAAAEEAGRWMPAPTLPGVSFKVRGIGNSDYKALAGKLRAEIPRSELLKGVSSEQVQKINVTLLVETVLQDWKGLEGDDDKPLKFTKAKAAELLADPNMRVLREAVEAAAALVGEDALAEQETDAKN